VPDGEELSTEDLARVEAALQREGVAILLEPNNGKCLSLDLSCGTAGLCEAALDTSVCMDENNQVMVSPPRSLVTRRRGDHACLYFIADKGWQDPFCLWLSMSGENASVAGAAWGDIPAPNGGLLDAKAYAFIDQAMRKNGDFGVYGSVVGGLKDLMEFMEVELKYREEEAENACWAVSAVPRDGHGHFLHFDIDASTGAIDGCMAGHLEPPPDDFGMEEFDGDEIKPAD
jgi:hypothetical protein